MYGHELRGPDDFFGPPRPGQTWEAYQQQMIHPAVIAGAGAAALLINPLVGALVLGAGYLMGPGAPHPKQKPKPLTQGG